MSKKPTDLLGETYALLDKELAAGVARGDSQAKVLTAVAAGSGVGSEWIKKLARRLIPNPGVRTIQTLHDYLAKSDPAAKNARPKPSSRRLI